MGGEIQLNSKAGHTDVEVTIPVELKGESLSNDIKEQQAQHQNSNASILFTVKPNIAEEDKDYQHLDLYHVEEEEKCVSERKKRRIDTFSESKHSIRISNEISACE